MEREKAEELLKEIEREGDPKKMDSLRQERLIAERGIENKLVEEKGKDDLPSDWKGDLQPHPLNFFPELKEEEFKGLVKDIRVNGLREPITLYEGKVLEGRARYKACLEAGRDPEFQELPPNVSPIAYVISKNGLRRHLTTSQRAVIALEYLPYFEVEAQERMKAGMTYPDCLIKGVDQEMFDEDFDKTMISLKLMTSDSSGANLPQGRRMRARDAVGAFLGVGGRYVGYARKVQSEAPELLKDVKNGYLNLHVALRLLRLPIDKRLVAISHIMCGEHPNQVLKDIKEVWDRNKAVKTAFRELKIWHKKYQPYKKFEVFKFLGPVFRDIELIKHTNLKWALRKDKI